jgi:hypothetical protein
LGLDLPLNGQGNSIKESFTTHKAFNVLWIIVILRPVNVYIWIKFETHVAKNVTRQLTYLVRHSFLELSQEFSPTKQNEQDQQKDDGVTKRQKYAVERDQHGQQTVRRCDSYHAGDGKSRVELELQFHRREWRALLVFLLGRGLL